MSTDSIAYVVGSNTVRIRDVVDADTMPTGGRIYYLDVTDLNGANSLYRVDVRLNEILRFTDQQLVEFLVRRAKSRKLSSSPT